MMVVENDKCCQLLMLSTVMTTECKTWPGKASLITSISYCRMLLFKPQILEQLPTSFIFRQKTNIAHNQPIIIVGLRSQHGSTPSPWGGETFQSHSAGVTT